MGQDLATSPIGSSSAVADIGHGNGLDGRATDPGIGSETQVRRSAPRVVLAGCPGAEKGTQGRRLAARLRVQHLATGDLLRDEIAVGSALRNAVERIVGAGRLLPTGLILAIVEANLGDGGYVLDGFPRTVAQAHALFDQPVLTPAIVIELVVPCAVALTRLRGRRRSDDEAVIARKRLALYEAETLPALAVFAPAGLLAQVDGTAAADVVEAGIWRELSRRQLFGGSWRADARLFPSEHPNAGVEQTKRRVVW